MAKKVITEAVTSLSHYSRETMLFRSTSSASKDYINSVVKNADVLAQSLVDRGWKLVSGGTDTHLLLMDLSDTEITGHDASLVS